MVEGEAVEEAGEDVEEEYTHGIVWSAPVGDEGALDDCFCLDGDRHGVLAVILDVLTVLDVLASFDCFFNFFGLLVISI